MIIIAHYNYDEQHHALCTRPCNLETLLYREQQVTLHEQLPLAIHHGQYISSHTGASAGWTPRIRVCILIVPACNAATSSQQARVS